MIHDQDNDAADYIEDRHKGDKSLGHSGDRLDSADDNKADDQTQNDTDYKRRYMQIQIEVGDNRVGLDHAADTKCTQRSQKGEHNAQPFHLKTSVQRIHGAADHGTVLTLHSVFDSNQRLRVLGRHTEDTGQPHPEHRARASKGDRRADTDDITGSDRGGQRRCERSELSE